MEQNIKIEKMHYQSNKLSFWLAIVGLLVNVIAMLSIYGTRSITPNLKLGVDLVINIIFMLIAFLVAERCKVYEFNWGIGATVLGGLEILRILFIPLGALNAKQIGGGTFTTYLLCYLIAGSCFILCGVICMIKSTQLKVFLANKKEVK